MAKLPIISGREFARFLQKHGFKEDRQRASHIILEKDGIARPVVIPDHRELSVGVIHNNLKTAGISRKDFIAELQRSKKKPSRD